jgi:hypothetical protein
MPTGTLKHKKGMNKLEAGEDFEASFRMSFHSKVSQTSSRLKIKVTKDASKHGGVFF